MKPIIFSSEMVRAIIEGRKTQTRRLVKPQPEIKDGVGRWMKSKNVNEVGEEEFVLDYILKYSPYKKGDVLYVKETFGVPIAMLGNVIYKSDYDDDKKRFPLADGEKWKPSIFMPQKLSRIFLEVTDVWVERLQLISNTDAFDEGIKTKGINFWYNYHQKDFSFDNPISSFRTLWDKIHKGTSHEWKNNPYVFGYKFKPLAKGVFKQHQ